MTLKTIETAAMKLPAAARGKLAAILLSSLESDDPAEIELAWIAEADRRYEAYRMGKTTARPARQAIAAARKSAAPMKVIFLHEAELEMVEAAEFYEEKQAVLDGRFLDAIERAVADIEDSPQRWPILAGRVRRRLAGTFPYGIFYRISLQEITIVAVAHLHRRPRYWVKRLRG